MNEKRVGKENNSSQGQTNAEAGFSISFLQQMFDTEIIVLPLRGMSTKNYGRGPERYKIAKRPTIEGWADKGYTGISEQEAQSWVQERGWLGLRIPLGYQLVDVDDVTEGELLYKSLLAEKKKFHAIRTPNGYQFVFRDNPKNSNNNAKRVTTSGLLVDFRISGKGYTVLPNVNTPGREWIHVEHAPLDTVPVYLEVTPAKQREFSVPIREGARNDTLFRWFCRLREYNQWDESQLNEIAGFINRRILEKPLPENEVKAALNQALQYQPSGRNYESEQVSLSFIYDLSQLEKCPAVEGTQLPKGWGFQGNTGALYQIRAGATTLVSHQPIVVTGRYENLTDGSVGLTVSWRDGYRWQSVKRGRDYFAVQSKLVELSNVGFPATSVNARKLVEYIHDFEAHNRHVMPEYRAVEQLGWIEGGFLIGTTYLNSQGEELSADDPQSVTFIAADTGDEQFIKGFQTSGSLENWILMIDKIKHYPKVITGVYASFASVLIDLLGANLFIFEWAGETSKGKTTAMRLAASVWGNPEERGEGIIKKWNTTLVNLERIASISNHLPVFLDDTKEGDPKMLPRTVYQLTSGQGKGRGSTRGTQRTKFWRNIIFSTGEQQITSFSNDGGAVGRTISVVGLPFKQTDHETFKLVRELEQTAKMNYGHAGRTFVSWLIRNREKWPIWRERWINLQMEYVGKVQNVSSVAGRLTEYFALIHLTAELLEQLFNRGWGFQQVVDVWDEVLANGEEMDRPREAVRMLYSAAQGYEERPEHLGIWEKNGGNWKDIKFRPDIIKDFFDKTGYEMRSTLKSWYDRGWLDTTPGRGYQKLVKRYGETRSYIVVKREALEQ